MRLVEADGLLEEHIALQYVRLVTGLAPSGAVDEPHAPWAKATHSNGKITAVEHPASNGLSQQVRQRAATQRTA